MNDSTELETTKTTPTARRFELWPAIVIGLVIVAVIAGGFFVATSGWLAPTGTSTGLANITVDEPVDGTREVDPSAPAPAVADFAVSPVQAECADDRGGATAPLTFSWDSSDADRAWIGVGTSDASISPTAEVPLSSDGWSELPFECFLDSTDYTLTVQGPGGTTSVMITVQRTIV